MINNHAVIYCNYPITKDDVKTINRIEDIYCEEFDSAEYIRMLSFIGKAGPKQSTDKGKPLIYISCHFPKKKHSFHQWILFYFSIFR